MKLICHLLHFIRSLFPEAPKVPSITETAEASLFLSYFFKMCSFVKCSVIIQHMSATEQTRALHWLVCGFCFCFLRSRGWHQGLVHATLVLYSGLHPQHLARNSRIDSFLWRAHPVSLYQPPTHCRFLITHFYYMFTFFFSTSTNYI